jgi:hypothetical protein
LTGKRGDNAEQHDAVERYRHRSEFGLPELVSERVSDCYEQAAAYQQRSTAGADGSPSGGGESKNGGNDGHTKGYVMEVAEMRVVITEIAAVTASGSWFQPRD